MLILIPALVLVLFVLGVISVDSAVDYLGHRELQDFTASAADQAAAAALNRGAFYLGEGTLAIRQDEADAIVEQARQTQTGGGLTIIGAHARLSDSGRTITVYATGVVQDVFAPAVGGRRSLIIAAHSSATLAQVRISP